VNSGYLVDVYGGQTAPGAQVIQWPATGRLNQQWHIADNGAGSYEIIGAQSKLSLDVYGANVNNNGRIITWTFRNSVNQQWLISLT
jgi:hypothetical protein